MLRRIFETSVNPPWISRQGRVDAEESRQDWEIEEGSSSTRPEENVKQSCIQRLAWNSSFVNRRRFFRFSFSSSCSSTYEGSVRTDWRDKVNRRDDIAQRLLFLLQLGEKLFLTEIGDVRRSDHRHSHREDSAREWRNRWKRHGMNNINEGWRKRFNRRQKRPMENIRSNASSARRLKLIERCECWFFLDRELRWFLRVFFIQTEKEFQQLVGVPLLFLSTAEEHIHLSLFSFCLSFDALRREKLI